jgi:hypothetical protein
MTHAEILLQSGPYEATDISRIWFMDDIHRSIVVILISSGFDRFSLPETHPQYAHYYDILMEWCNDDGWVIHETKDFDL